MEIWGQGRKKRLLWDQFFFSYLILYIKVTGRTWFWINFSCICQSLPTKSTGDSQNDFKFSGKLPLIGIDILLTNNNYWDIVEVVPLLERTIFFWKTEFLVIFWPILLPNWCKWNQNNMEIAEILHPTIFHYLSNIMKTIK